MNTQKLLNMLGVVALTIATVFVLGTVASKSENLGGSFNPVPVDFAEGITVDGTTIITGAGAMYVSSPVLTPTADTTLTVAQTGSVVNMGTAGLDITLPAPTTSAGVSYRFVVSAAFATTAMTIVSGTADLIEGSLIVAGAVVACDAADLISISATSEDIGDFVDVFSNGTKWVIGANQAMTASQHTCSG